MVVTNFCGELEVTSNFSKSMVNKVVKESEGRTRRDAQNILVCGAIERSRATYVDMQDISLVSRTLVASEQGCVYAV